MRDYVTAADIGKTGACHLFRHTCATLMLEGGADIRFIQQLLGHEKLETTQIYAQVSIRHAQGGPHPHASGPAGGEHGAHGRAGRGGSRACRRGGQSVALCPMKFTVTIDRDETGTWVAECPAIPGCVSQGATKPAALKNVREAIELCLEVRAERGLPLTVETKQVEVAV